MHSSSTFRYISASCYLRTISLSARTPTSARCVILGPGQQRGTLPASLVFQARLQASLSQTYHSVWKPDLYPRSSGAFRASREGDLRHALFTWLVYIGIWSNVLSPLSSWKQCGGSGTSFPGLAHQAHLLVVAQRLVPFAKRALSLRSRGHRVAAPVVRDSICPGATPFSAPGSSNPGACSGSGNTTPALSCQQDPNTRLPSRPCQPASSAAQCPPTSLPKSTQKNCPVYKNSKGTTGYECVDVANDLESCGGCVGFSRDGRKSEDGGRDCSAIPGVDTVECTLGKCVIKRCRSGYKKARFGDGCIPTMSFLEQSRRGLRG
ncbi:hypothetical protein BD779DRAFT_1470986 [Infundibulicybe gibba]|nr:hypothetical protein BD779DRAFT_1470986 [Infundibulicybe gibba]